MLVLEDKAFDNTSIGFKVNPFTDSLIDTLIQNDNFKNFSLK
jgi:hypothetical protein